tara:strand:- start:119 stop:430 length:312 start_codon:yes stop_codon:yes gene_type:complete
MNLRIWEEESMHEKLSLCGGCGWNTVLEDYFFVGRLQVGLEECDRFVRTGEIRNLDIGICSLHYLTHHFVGAWKFAGDFLTLVHLTLCSYWILKISSEYFHKI